MDILRTIAHRLNIVGAFKELGSTPERRRILLCLSVAQLLMQLSQLPITIAVPSVARHFDISYTQGAWMVVIRLLILGSTVFLAARLGQRYGTLKVFFIGLIVLTLSSALAATSQYYLQLLLWSAGVGFGGALISANLNSLLVLGFRDTERGRAFAIPITSARMGTMMGLVIFGLLLEYMHPAFGWRVVFLTSVPIGIFALWLTWPLFKFSLVKQADSEQSQPLGLIGPSLMICSLLAFILMGIHLHTLWDSGPDSFVTEAALIYHPSMLVIFLVLFLVFFVIQIVSKQPFLNFGYFKQTYFSMALFSNTTFHLSMLSVLTLMPIIIEVGLGYTPSVTMMVLLPHQSMGLFLPIIAGWIYDRYQPKWLRPMSLLLIAIGIGLLGLFAHQIPIYILPVLLFPASIGSALFNSPNNALVMNTLPQDRSFASGMLETTRQMGHTVGTITAAAIVGLSVPIVADAVSIIELQRSYIQGFRNSALTVVWIMLAGSLVAMFQYKGNTQKKQET